MVISDFVLPTSKDVPKACGFVFRFSDFEVAFNDLPQPMMVIVKERSILLAEGEIVTIPLAKVIFVVPSSSTKSNSPSAPAAMSSSMCCGETVASSFSVASKGRIPPALRTTGID